MSKFTNATIISLIISLVVGTNVGFTQSNPELREKEHIFGNESAVITLVTFGDTECPFCQQLHWVLKDLQAKYPDTVKLVYRNFPLTSIHPFAYKEAKALECADEIGGNDAFWKMLDRLFTTPVESDPNFQPRVSNPFMARPKHMRWLMRHSRNSGVLRTKLSKCVSQNQTKAKVDADIADGQAAGVQGTPTTFVFNAGIFKLTIVGAQPQNIFEEIINKM